MKLYQLLLIIGLYLSNIAIYAIEIQQDIRQVSGSTWQYEFEVTNNGSLGSGVTVEGFNIEFDTSLFDESSLTIATTSPLSTQWNEILLGSAPGLPALYDALALSGGIATGQSASTFIVRFTYLGSGTPTAVPFSVYNASTFAVLEQGNVAVGNVIPTAATPNTTAISIPTLNTWMLILLMSLLTLVALHQYTPLNRRR